MSVTTVDEVRAMVESPLSDVVLQDVIDREEAWLARRVGPLTGSRAVVIPEPPRHDPITLSRAVSTVTVTDAGIAVVVDVVGQTIRRDDLLGWVWPVSITYTPDDEDEVRRVVIELVREALSRSPYQSESIGDYSYTRGGRDGSGMIGRRGLVRSLLPGLSAPFTVSLLRPFRR